MDLDTQDCDSVVIYKGPLNLDKKYKEDFEYSTIYKRWYHRSIEGFSISDEQWEDLKSFKTSLENSSDSEINHPVRYNRGNIEVIDFIEDQKLGFHEGNIIKYVCRYPDKNGIEDLKKAKWYLERLIIKLENGKKNEK